MDHPGAVLRLVVAYDGTAFHGFAAQRGQAEIRTVGGVIEAALARVLRTEVQVAVAGRTDAGVHAWGQIVSVPVPPDTDADRVGRAVDRMLGPEVVIREASLRPVGFDARHSAVWRHYRYTIVNRPVADPFRARYAWWVPEPLDRARLRLAADPFIGEHDFASFCRKGPEGSTTVRRVLRSEWFEDDDGVLRYEIRAHAFCWQMVRSIVGTLVEAGLGVRPPGGMLEALRARDRAAAGRIAPPHGLCLWAVGEEPPSV